jgi:hypothetical protein
MRNTFQTCRHFLQTIESHCATMPVTRALWVQRWQVLTSRLLAQSIQDASSKRKRRAYACSPVSEQTERKEEGGIYHLRALLLPKFSSHSDPQHT